MIIVKDLSRLGRNHIGVSTYLESIFPLFNVRFVSINDNYNNHIIKNVMDKIDIPFKNVMYDYISYDISKKVKSTFDMKKRKVNILVHLSHTDIEKIQKTKIIIL